MNGTIVWLTVRQVLGRRRSFFMALGGLLPVLIAALFAINASGRDPTPEEFAASALMDVLVMDGVLPLVALVFGTAVLGTEIDEGTAPYLLSKPISRAQIILSKLMVAWVATLVAVVPASVVAVLVALEGSDPHNIALAFGAALAVGSLGYSCVFVLFSVLTSRALIVGLLYVFIWEGIVTNLFTGTRLFSVREFSLAIADAITSLRPSEFEAHLGLTQGVLLMAAVIVGATSFAIYRLERFEIGEST